jgi:hypothetical protein
LLSFDKPHGGEIYQAGQTRQIKLNARRAFKTVKLELSYDGGVTYELLGIIDNKFKHRALRNIFNWKIDYDKSMSCILRETATLNTGPVVQTGAQGLAGP